jgi:hydrogenase maturation factor HypF (carbamoyltransferase family)
MKKCNYRKCNNILNFEEHQNRDYCAEEEGKKSCYMLEKIIRTKENTAIKKRLKIRETEIQNTLYTLTLHQKSKTISVDRFFDLFANFLDLFERKIVRQSTVLFYENFDLFKIVRDQIEYIKINQNEKNKYQ